MQYRIENIWFGQASPSAASRKGLPGAVSQGASSESLAAVIDLSRLFISSLHQND